MSTETKNALTPAEFETKKEQFMDCYSKWLETRKSVKKELDINALVHGTLFINILHSNNQHQHQHNHNKHEQSQQPNTPTTTTNINNNNHNIYQQ